MSSSDQRASSLHTRRLETMQQKSGITHRQTFIRQTSILLQLFYFAQYFKITDTLPQNVETNTSVPNVQFGCFDQ